MDRLDKKPSGSECDSKKLSPKPELTEIVSEFDPENFPIAISLSSYIAVSFNVPVYNSKGFELNKDYKN